MALMAFLESLIIFRTFKQRLHPFYFKVHFDTGRKQFNQGDGSGSFFCVHSSAYGGKQMRVLRCDNLFRA